MGSIPGAVNVPLLDDLERHDVGLLYKQEGKASAVALGVELFATKADRFFDKLSQFFEPRREVVLYCARGGMRSQSVARWLSNSGVRASILDGGYKSFRRQVLELLDQLARHPKLVLNGRTGCGKTQLIRALSAEASGAIDLEDATVSGARPLGDWRGRGRLRRSKILASFEWAITYK